MLILDITFPNKKKDKLNTLYVSIPKLKIENFRSDFADKRL